MILFAIFTVFLFCFDVRLRPCCPRYLFFLRSTYRVEASEIPVNVNCLYLGFSCLGFGPLDLFVLPFSLDMKDEGWLISSHPSPFPFSGWWNRLRSGDD